MALMTGAVGMVANVESMADLAKFEKKAKIVVVVISV